MGFINLPSDNPRTIGSDGDPKAKICIVGEAPCAEDIKKGKPFTGQPGSVLDHCLHAAQLIRSNCYLTNFIKQPMNFNNIVHYFNPDKGFTEKGMEWVNAIREEVNQLECDLVIPLGNAAMFALLGWEKSKPKITNARGYIFKSAFIKHPVMPSIHPQATLRGNYLWRYYIMHDFQKAKRIVSNGGWKPPHRHTQLFSPGITQDMADEFHRNNTDTCVSIELIDFESCIAILEYINEHERSTKVSFDIEVNNYEVSCISFSINQQEILEIDLCNTNITIEQELVIWKCIARIMGNPYLTKVVQNGIFDIHFLAFKNHIITRGPIEDTMIAHSLIYPDFEKSLGFLASLYSDQPYWKDMVKFNNIKKES